MQKALVSFDIFLYKNNFKTHCKYCEIMKSNTLRKLGQCSRNVATEKNYINHQVMKVLIIYNSYFYTCSLTL
jgi:hypothetical protein